MFTIKGKYTEATIMIDVLEDTCIAQITKMCNNEVFINPIVIMPDAHTGSGSCVGFTMVMSDKIIPNVVSVDIGCGMLSMNVGKIDFDHEAVDKKIREIVPFGMNWHDTNGEQYKKNIEVCKNILDNFYEKISREKYNEILENMTTRLGTLGGG